MEEKEIETILKNRSAEDKEISHTKILTIDIQMKKEIKLTYLKKSKKFLDKNSGVITENQVDELVIKFVKKHFYNIDINVDYKQLQGNLKDIFRIRKGNIRIILKVVDDEIIIEAIIEDIGFRGDVYKQLITNISNLNNNK